MSTALGKSSSHGRLHNPTSDRIVKLTEDKESCCERATSDPSRGANEAACWEFL